MGASDKMEAGIDKAKGKVKESVGEMTDNEKLEAEGKLDQVKGDAKSAVENAKDGFKDAFDK
ncbi:CsbD family protein [Leucobacter denitrificans]|uniref:CsbD family protein n=1 Tax=Leucobacter denitrificans TaxID=683042 RepID=A0A7G9S4A1_9MICO|nr:CsbD family protein [Leucobacter denitrificans]QNN62676.1 CsbD family protein [Leucobacter denitrificans]